ncbi:MAG TPA: hypothetical protein VEV45_20915 [Streptosporangiaceae bacterium]|nr:hypothetical protein [Streptosporangiaceae bacterium]
MTINGSVLPAEIRRLAAQLAEMQQRITQLERGASTAQLANASIEGGTLTINDDSGNAMIQLGAQDDGTFAHVAVNASPPPQPSDPVVNPAILSAMVAWDGNMADGSSPLSDLAGVQVHCSITPGFTPGPNTLQSTFIAQGVRPIGGLLAGYSYYICLVCVNQAGLTGPPSNVVPVIPNQPISPGEVITQPVLVGSTTLGYATTTPRGPVLYDFEFDLQGFGLDTGCTCTLGLDNTMGFTGAQAAVITCDGLTWPVVIGPPIPVVLGDPLWVQFIYQGSINLGATFVGIRWYDSNGVLYNESDVGPAPISGEPGQWWAFSVGDTAQKAGYARVVFGDEEIPAAGTQIWFDDVQVSGNLGFAFSAVTDVDSVGNPYNQGISIFGLPGLQEAVAVYDAAGRNVQAAIDSMGNFTGQVMAANTDLYAGGQSLLNDILPPYPLGLIAYTGVPASSLPYPSTPTTGSISIEEIDFQAVAGRRYMIMAEDFNFAMAASGGVKLFFYGTNDGTAPSTSSTLLARGMVQRAADTNNWSGPFIHTFTSQAGALWKILFAALANGTSATLQLTAMEANPGDDLDGTLNLRLSIIDLGIAPPIGGQVILNSTGGAGGGTTKTTYTKTYNCTHTYSYQGSDGGNPNLKIDTDGNCYQGGDYGNTYNGRAKTWFTTPSSMVTDLSGATINWAKMYLNNNHTWYNSGMTLSMGNDSRTSFGSTAGDPGGATGYFHVAFSEGQAKWFTLPSSMYSALTSSSRNLVIWAGTNSLSYYGYFAGAGQSGRPQIQINYTK